MDARLIGVLLTLGLTLISRQALAAVSVADLAATNLRCEYRHNPLGLGETRPRLGWVLESKERGAAQTAYRILVASTPERLAGDQADLWDSGKVESNRTTQIVYAGRALTSRQACFWKVMAWDREGQPGEWSEPASWEMGLLQPEDWTAEWIEAGAHLQEIEIERATYYTVDGEVRKDVTDAVRAMAARGDAVVASNEAFGGDPKRNVLKRLEVVYRCAGATLTADVAENATATLGAAPQPYLRRAFQSSKSVTQARLFVTALGMYEVYLNGERVGDEHLAPGWTDYRERVRYQAFDVTDQLRRGENVIGAMVGPGWFSGRAGLFRAQQYYGKTPALCAQLEMTYSDGSSVRIVSDASWIRHDGPLLAADIMDGEVYDAKAAIDGWNTPGLDTRDWTPVEVREEARSLEWSIDQPVRALQELPALSVSEPSPGGWVFDLGQNMVGVIRLKVQAKAGTRVTIRHAEMLNADGTVYTTNLRGAAATDTYICRGGGIEEWQPRFTFHGFRYVELTGLDDKPDVSAVTGIVLGTDVPHTGTFACSDDRLNQLQSNIVWGLHGNYLSIPTDCPQRDERMGWMADTQVFVPTATYNRDIAPFMTKWMVDVRDAQRQDGAHSDVAPVMNGLNYGTPAWADAGTVVPWAIYQVYGDERILDRNIESMMRWVDWCKEHSTDLIRDRDRGNDYGDWLSIGANTPKDLIGTAYFAHSADIVGKSLRVLGRDSEAEEYERLFEAIRTAFQKQYLQSDGRLHGDTQTCYILALAFDLLPEELRPNAVNRLIADVQSKEWHISTGFVGVSMMLPVLTEAGRADAAYRVLMQDTFPSWLFSVKHGATTIWERWDGWTPERGMQDPGMNSFNHYALGSCGEWFYAGICGIEREPGHPGFDRFTVRPRVGGSLEWAKATFDSMHGRIESGWKKQGATFSFDVRIPANTTATVYVPAGDGAVVTESGVALDRANGVSVVRRDRDAVVLELGSGSYSFAASQPAEHGAGASKERSGNPVFDGWYADPEAAVFGDRFWIYPTYSARYIEQQHFDAFSSPDLVHWTRHENVLTQKDVPWVWRALWAPSVVNKDGKYYFFFGANDIQSDGEVGGIGVAVSDRPEGPFKDYLGRPLVDKFHNGAQPIDQFAFHDADGQWYLIYGGWRHCNIARLSDDFTGFEPYDDGTVFKEITPDQYVEGPFMFVRGGQYYFMWSEGGWTGPNYSVAYAIADSPLGPFKRVGKILQQDPSVATGAGHHSVLNVPGTDDWYIVYHRRPLGETDGNHRVVCIDRMEFDSDGKIKPVKITFEGVLPATLD